MDLGVGQVPDADPRAGGAEAPFGVPPGPALGPGRAGLQPQPGGQHRADVCQSGQRRAARRVAQPGRSHPGRGEPAPARPGGRPPGDGDPGAAPPGHDGAQPRGLDSQPSSEEVVGGAVVLGGQDQAADVAAAEPDLAVVGAARRFGDGVVPRPTTIRDDSAARRTRTAGTVSGRKQMVTTSRLTRPRGPARAR